MWVDGEILRIGGGLYQENSPNVTTDHTFCKLVLQGVFMKVFVNLAHYFIDKYIKYIVQIPVLPKLLLPEPKTTLPQFSLDVVLKELHTSAPPADLI